MTEQAKTAETKNEVKNGFQPRILACLCNWCSYAGADLAGISRLQYPPNVVVVRVMCTGTISPHHILKAFQKGADGVLVGGCHIGDCHYMRGNFMTVKRVAVVKELLKFAGLEGGRLHLEWVSASEGQKFADLIRSFTEKITKLGPSPIAARRKGKPVARSWKDEVSEAFRPTFAYAEPDIEKLRTRVAGMMKSNEIAGFLGLRLQNGQAAPYLFVKEKPEELKSLTIGDARYPVMGILRRLSEKYPDKTFGVMARGCDERVLRELVKFQQVKPGQVKLVGVACSEEQAKACGCETPYPAEITAGEKTAGVGSDATLAEIEKLPPAQRLTYWLESFDRCIKCYGCKSICPMCFCTDCNLQNKTLVPAGQTPPESPIFHLTRAMHMAGRCIDCGLCEEACPAHIPLRALYKKVGDIVEELFGYKPGAGMEGRSPQCMLGETVPFEASDIKD